jgi:GGDEF domain-containing protein
LQAMSENVVLEEDTARDNTLIILERRARLTISAEIAETVRRLLAPLYEEIGDWHPYFLPGPRDLSYPATDFESSTNPADRILNSLANLVVRLGGQTAENADRWRFCCILLPTNPLLPLQRRSLVVRAQSTGAPHKIGVTMLSPNEPIISLTLRAFQSGHVIYRAEVPEDDPTIALRELEEPISSAIAIPVGGEGGQSVAVIYIASDESGAFPEEDQRVLRMIGRMVEELLMTYRARQQVTEKLGKLITNPRTVDPLFGDFLSENEFISEVEYLLTNLLQDEVSFIAIDIDNQSGLANMYGDLVTRNLSRAVGLRIQGVLRALSIRLTGHRLYHIYAGRFYLLLDGTPLEQARDRAEQLRNALEGTYKIDAKRSSIEQATLPGSMLELLGITVRLGVTSYTQMKLEEVLQRYPSDTAVAKVRALITRSLDQVLILGQQEGGNVIISWDRDKWDYRRWSPAS